jgi:aminopeptidase
MICKMDKGCEIVLNQCLQVKPGEKALIVTDETKLSIGTTLYRKALELGNEAVLTLMPDGKVSGEEPPTPVGAAMKSADVVICPTSVSLTHTRARLEAAAAGARIATMPGITEEMFWAGPILADYVEVEKASQKVSALLTGATHCRILTGERYELKINLSGREGVASTGVYKEKGASGNLPSGEGYIAPVEDGADGEFFVDGSIVGIGLLPAPVIMRIEKGRLVDIEGSLAEKVWKAIPNNVFSRTIGELGIGTNPMARITGVILEDEKVYGSVHIAFGTNITFGGKIKAPSHIDCVTVKPTVYLDDTPVVVNGNLII